MTRYVFTATAGRSGQNYLSALLLRHVPGALVLFEEPQVRPILPRPLDSYERRFRRRFIETHELLGRGKVLDAFVAGDDTALEHMAAERLAWIGRRMARAKADIYIDVSKYFIRGLHQPMTQLLPGSMLIRLVRDPIRNMRSFLNRGKDIYLDNNSPDARANQLRLDPSALSQGELYLWAWCEVYLRAQALADEGRIAKLVEIRTEELTDLLTMTRHLATLGLSHTPLNGSGPMNDNVAQGFGATLVTAEDIAIFERFLDRLPDDARRRIDYFRGYDPRRIHDHVSTPVAAQA
jgi:hypothetical protein